MIVKSDTIEWNEFEFDIYSSFQQEVMTLSILEKMKLDANLYWSL